MLRQRTEKVEHLVADQFFRTHILDQQPIHRGSGLARETQKRCPAGRLIAERIGDQSGEGEQPALRIDGGRNVGRAKRIEQRAKRFVEIEVAHHRHPRHEQSRRPDLTGMANECLGNGAARAAAWHQQGQAGQPELGVGIARDQSCNQRIGKPAMRRDRIDLRPLPLSHP